MIARSLVSLRERVMIGLPGFGAPETANIRLHLALLFDLDCYNLDLVVGEADLDLEHGWHDELVGLYRIEVVLLLLLHASGKAASWDVDLVLPKID